MNSLQSLLLEALYLSRNQSLERYRNMQRFNRHLVHTQQEQSPNTVPNNAGGFSFQVDDWTRLQRFLILGTEGGSYYATERKMTRDSAAAVERCIAADHKRVVDIIVSVSEQGRAPKNDPALFALAMASKLAKDPLARAYAMEALPKVARIGTHLFHFAEYVKGFGGWGRGTVRGFQNWYEGKSDMELAHQITKYKSRDGWSHRDILRKAHPHTADFTRNSIYRFVTKGEFELAKRGDNAALHYILATEEAQTCDRKKLVELIAEYKLPREVVPTEALNDPAVWNALLPHMGVTALVRNLGKLTAVGVVGPLSNCAKQVLEALRNSDQIKRSKIHPVQLLVAYKTYSNGHGDKGSLSWTPNPNVVAALEDAFYASFGNVEPSNKKTLLALDVSESMTSNTIAGMSNITAREASAVMAMVTLRSEAESYMCGFSSRFIQLKITPRDSLDAIMSEIANLPFSYTDPTVAIKWALDNKVPAEVFAVYTDNEVNGPSIPPARAIKEYRQKTGIAAKLIVVGMCVNKFTIADPSDGGMMDVCGFDTAAPNVMADFARGRE